MVRSIFLPTPNINKQRLLTTDEQPSLSPGLGLRHTAEEPAHKQVCLAARGRVGGPSVTNVP